MAKRSWNATLSNLWDFGHRSDYAFSKTGTPLTRNPFKKRKIRETDAKLSSFDSRNSASAPSGLLASVTLVSTQRAHAAVKNLDANELAAQEAVSGMFTVTSGTTGSVGWTRPDAWRNTVFGELRQWGDNTQGRSNYSIFPTIRVSDLDNALLQYNDMSSGVQSGTGAHFDFCDSHLVFRNNCSAKCELDCWLLYPKADVPVTASMTSAFFYDSTTWGNATPLITNAYQSTLMPAANASFTSDTKFSSGDQLFYNDWSSTPLENPEITHRFHVVHKGKWFLNPGDETEYFWGLRNGQLVHPMSQIQYTAAEAAAATTPFATHFAYMKRCGPLVLFRGRGRLAHDESKENTTPSVNFGSFRLQWALVTKGQWRQCRPFDRGISRFRTTVPTASAPSQVNLSTAANSTEWYHTLPTEEQATS